jgi:hypothetical protein
MNKSLILQAIFIKFIHAIYGKSKKHHKPQKYKQSKNSQIHKLNTKASHIFKQLIQK